MKAFLWSLIFILAIGTFAQADTTVNTLKDTSMQKSSNSGFKASAGGFIALDLMTLEKQEDKSTDVGTGIGVLDLKIYGRYDKFSSKIKLDLDDSRLSDKYNIFEEVTISFQPYKYLKITTGKGVVPFRQKHWGVIKGSYVDGGSIIDNSPYRYWTDIDEQIFTSIRVGSWSYGIQNTFSMYSDSKVVDRNSDGSPKIDKDSGEYKTISSKKYNTKDSQGFANKLEIFPTRGLSLFTAAAIYKDKLQYPSSTYLVGLGGKFEYGPFEIWNEMSYGSSQTDSKTKYGFQHKHEVQAQLGGSYSITDTVDVLTNLEYGLVNIKNHLEDGHAPKDNNTIYKIEAGTKYNFNTKTFVTVGGIYEKLDRYQGMTAKYDAKTTDADAFGFTTSLSYWF